MKKKSHNRYPPWSPRIWTGMRAGDWIRILKEGRFRIHPAKYAMTVLVGGCSLVNTPLSFLQRTLLDRKIARTELVAPPVFIVGHWRSGTTLLHELFSLDDGWASPDSYDAFMPHHLLLTSWVKPLVNVLMPGQRPMDSMALQAASPQEDDFALISLGAPTPYRDIGFCKYRSIPPIKMLALDQAEPETIEAVRKGLDYFYRTLTRLYNRRLVLKSPPHTGRIALLSKWFPGAKFVHISRNPQELVPSTMKLWRALDMTQGIQRPRYTDSQLLDYINASARAMYDSYFRQRKELAPDDLVEVRFEDLLENPAGTIRTVFESLQLPVNESQIESVRKYFADRKDHSKGKAAEDPTLARQIDTNWSQYRTEFGYEMAPAL